MERKITFGGVFSEGFAVGLKNAPSLLGALVLWLLTIWIPYINVGTTIAIASIPIALSEGKVISPLFIFDKKYRTMMGEYFLLVGLMYIAIVMAMMFLVVPALVIATAWSLSVYILIDKQISPTEALVASNRATMGYKWIIFGVQFVLGLIAGLCMAGLRAMFGAMDVEIIGTILSVIVMIIVMVAMLGCESVIYRKLVKE